MNKKIYAAPTVKVQEIQPEELLGGSINNNLQQINAQNEALSKEDFNEWDE